ncbi:MAG: hypothetical protein LKF96_02120 [Treponema sp.]|nr:hypothetical protein [Treponema sp.]
MTGSESSRDGDSFFEFLSRTADGMRLPAYEYLYSLLDRTATVLENEFTVYRPDYTNGGERKAGSLLDFKNEVQLPLVIVPDLHARPNFLLNLYNFQLPRDFTGGTAAVTVGAALESGKIRVVCVGDALHSELRGFSRWMSAREEFHNSDYTGYFMSQEMAEGLSLAIIVMESKCRWVSRFHFLKGNHENITNREGGGDHPFCKFADEGQMVKDFMITKYGDDILYLYSCVEDALPLAAVFPQCVISHAEPLRAFSREELISARDHAEIVHGLTWTSNGEARDDSVMTMLKTLLGPEAARSSYYFAGHRPVTGNYALRQNGKFIQIHNPSLQNVALVYTDRIFNPDTDIHSVG